MKRDISATTEELITHMWSGLAGARAAYPVGKAIETVSGSYVTATRYEATTRQGHPAIAVYGQITWPPGVEPTA